MRTTNNETLLDLQEKVIVALKISSRKLLEQKISLQKSVVVSENGVVYTLTPHDLSKILDSTNK